MPKNELKEYNPREDLNQFGSGYEIIEVPFNVSPFGVLDSARRKVGHNCHVNDMRIDERDWKTNLAAAYPVMVPIYVAEFEFTPDSSDESSYSYRVVMHAGEEQVRVDPVWTALLTGDSAVRMLNQLPGSPQGDGWRAGRVQVLAMDCSVCGYHFVRAPQGALHGEWLPQDRAD